MLLSFSPEIDDEEGHDEAEEGQAPQDINEHFLSLEGRT